MFQYLRDLLAANRENTSLKEEVAKYKRLYEQEAESADNQKSENEILVIQRDGFKKDVEKLKARETAMKPAIEAMVKAITDIGEAVNMLPEELSNQPEEPIIRGKILSI